MTSEPTNEPLGVDEVATFSLAGLSNHVSQVRGFEGVCRLFRYEIVASLVLPPSIQAPAAEALVGEAATLVLSDREGNQRTVSGIVAAAETRFHEVGRVELVATLVPGCALLDVGRRSRALVHSTIIDVARAILDASRVSFRVELGASYVARAYWAQHGETDWAFLTRHLAEEGIFWWFDSADGSTLVLSDRSTSAPPIGGTPAQIVFAFDTGQEAARELVSEIGCVAELVGLRHALRSFDWTRPALDVEAAWGEGEEAIYDAPGAGPADPEVLLARARIQVDAARVSGALLRGRTTSVRLEPGRVFEVSGHPSAALDGAYFVVSVEPQVDQRRRAEAKDQGRNYRCVFEVIPAGVPFRAPVERIRPRGPGATLGVVVGAGEIDPDEAAQIAIKPRWDPSGCPGTRVRVAQRCTAESLLIPRVGWTMLTLFEEGALYAPLVFKRIHDAEHPPEYSLPAHDTRVVWKTATSPGAGSYNEIHYEDRAGAEELFVNASKDMNVLVQNMKRRNIGNDHVHEIGVDHDLDVAVRFGETVHRDQREAIGGSDTLTVDATCSKSIGGCETTLIGRNRVLLVGDKDVLGVRGRRTVEVGGSMSERTNGPSGIRCGEFALEVGGSVSRTAGASLSENIGELASSRVGGHRVEIVNGSRVLNGKASLCEVIGGSTVTIASGSYAESADKLLELRVGETLRAQAPEIFFEAKRRIDLLVGESLITLLPDSIEITARRLDLDGMTLNVVAKKFTANT